MYRSVLLSGIVLCVSGCVPDLEAVEVPGCVELELRDEVELVVTAAAPMALRLSEGVVLDSRIGIQLSGTGQAELSCTEIKTIQLLGDARLYADSTPNLSSLRAYGRSQVAIDAISTSMLEIRASGQAQIAISGLDTDRLDMQGGGQSQLAVQGSTGEAAFDLAGESALDADTLQAQDASLSGPGTAPVSLWATAHLHLAADVVREPALKGTPDVTDDREGSL